MGRHLGVRSSAGGVAMTFSHGLLLFGQVFSSQVFSSQIYFCQVFSAESGPVTESCQGVLPAKA
jgi:hypothetical protein